jgi:hypothetical protein
MSAYGTKKPGGDAAIQMTFPAVFAATAANNRMPFAYYPDPENRPAPLYESHDLQGYYHEQKRTDAHHMAMAAVKSRHDSDYRAEHSHAGYFGMPKPVLSQRKYANPSNGNIADIYSNRPVFNGGMYGGVLYTTEAQKWGRNKLRERVEQLNAIDAAYQGLQTGTTLGEAPVQVPVGVPEGALPESVSTKAKIELVATLQSIYASVQSGRANNFAYSDVVKFLRLLFRWAATADEDELKEVLEYVNGIEQSLLGIEAEMTEGADAAAEEVEDNRYWDEILDIMRKVREYVRRMIGVANASPAERRAASANFVKALGFARLAKAPTAEAVRQQLKDEQRADVRSEARRIGLPEEAFDYDDDAVFPPYTSRYVVGSERAMEASKPARGSQPLFIANRQRLARVAREERESLADQYEAIRAEREATRAAARARFDRNPRDEAGARNGAFFGEALPEGADVGVMNPMRNMAEAQMPDGEEEDEEEEEESADSTAATEETRSLYGQYRRPTWLSRDALSRKSPAELRAIAKRLSDGGYGVYIPRADTSGPTIRRRIINLWLL